jgi:hypothetical protein
MAERIPGRDGTLIVHDNFAPYGSIPGTAERAEDPSRYKPRLVRDTVYQKRRGWTDEQFATARDFCGFPAGQLIQRAKRFSWGTESWREYRESDLEAWESRIRSLKI